MQYCTSDIVIHNWAKLNQTENGKWKRVWQISLKDPLPETVNLNDISQDLSNQDFQVIIKVLQRKHLEVCVTTQRWGWDDDFYFATYKMFEKIDCLLGTIDTIQGQERDLWNPWLQKKKLSNS
ncbi:MAG: hypothetical protein SAL07_24080 [Oscillatoria sp. PMC 1051.18]|nr:hypothetical protein [Oscillatoria sp. PMC 1050.18]MEC5032989.1 hypothetical protein [Oscillatoria sp. PMC 1051.18]